MQVAPDCCLKVAKVLDLLNHLLPVERLLVGVSQLLQFAVEVLQFGSEFLRSEWLCCINQQ